MSLLNRQAYVMENDRLVYDAKHPRDAKAVCVEVSGEEGGVIKRGQVLDCADGVYSVHAAGGTASVIAAEETEYGPGDTEITVPVYISGSFRTSALIADVELTGEDVEALRGKGIYLK